MNNNILKIGLLLVASAVIGLTSCNKEPDESNLYTFTGETIQDFLEKNDDQLSDFNYIMKRSGYNRMMSTYGQYTCFAPVNSGVEYYIDSLYNDPDAHILHNGIADKGDSATFVNLPVSDKLEALSDSLCTDIAKFHIAGQLYTTVDNFNSSTGQNINTLYGTPFIAKLNDAGDVLFNDKATITTPETELTNGYVDIIDNVIPRSSRLITDELDRHAQFSLFVEALKATGLIDSLQVSDKGKTYTVDNSARPGESWGKLYYPNTCKVKFTIFAETNDVFAANGINNLSDLVAKCKEWYAKAADSSDGWYDYAKEKGWNISTGDDYTNRQNVLNMFVAYHILKAGMTYSHLVYVKDNSNSSNWNYSFGGEPHDYYETMLPNTLMKIWQPLYSAKTKPNRLYINRYVVNNTLTDEVGTMGSDAMHTSMLNRDGVMVDNTQGNYNIQSLNGYIHGINDVLLYDYYVPNGVLHERMRLDACTFEPECINNDVRFATSADISARNIYDSKQDGQRVIWPHDFFDGFKTYREDFTLAFCVQGAWRAWESDQFQGWGPFDFAFKLPHVPTGDYEIRIVYPPMSGGCFMQYYIGNSSSVGSMQPLGLPFDTRYPNVGEDADREATGYLYSTEFTDYGVASDLILRNHGYMRAPASLSRGTYNKVVNRITSPDDLISDISCCSRYEEGYGTMLLRRILGTTHIEQGKDYWIRIKSLLTDNPKLGFSLDFIELVPTSVVNSQDYTEDWY